MSQWELDLRSVPDHTDDEIRLVLPRFLWPKRLRQGANEDDGNESKGHLAGEMPCTKLPDSGAVHRMYPWIRTQVAPNVSDRYDRYDRCDRNAR
jgi:hypothetical protein